MSSKIRTVLTDLFRPVNSGGWPRLRVSGELEVAAAAAYLEMMEKNFSRRGGDKDRSPLKRLYPSRDKQILAIVVLRPRISAN